MEFRDEQYGVHAPTMRAGRDGLSDRSTPELLQELVENGRILISEEVRLARAELRDEAKKAGKAGAGFGVGGVLLHTALLAFGACLIALGALVMPVFLSALIVTVLFAAGGAIAMVWAKKRAETIYPDQTIRTLKEDKEWAKGTMQSVKFERHGHA